MATKKRARRARKAVLDVKAAAANDVQPVTVEQILDTAERAEKAEANGNGGVVTSAVKTGAAYHVLAGRPSKPAVIGVFTKAGYALSWVERAKRLGITPEELCRRFKDDPEQLKADWAALTAKKA